VTWQVTSFAVLAVALALGFAWYERSHPSAKVLALVATLAALAALGRIAFAPLPNIKPTTDIVLLSGFALGGAPGFIVGAVAALASNLFFGQGPYTPWQMVGWGAVGVFGAGLAAAFGRELGRWALAAACGAAGLAYGVWMEFHTWVLYSGHTPGELVGFVVGGAPFTIAHAVGNVAFCLLFGPILVRALLRFRARFEIVWRPAPVAGAAALAVAVLVLAPAAPAQAATEVEYLRAAQTADGGFADARGGSVSDPFASGWAVIGLAAAGHDPGPKAAAYLRRYAQRVTDVGDMERTILALRAAGQPTRALAAKLARKQLRNGSYENLVNRTAFAVLAFRAAGRTVPAATLRWLRRQQNRDGGWSTSGRGAPSGIDDTAAAVMALGRRAPVSAIRWLLARQGPDGGFPLMPGQPSNAQSTAFVVTALLAAGRDPAKVRRNGSRTPLQYLRSLRNPDGSIRYSRTSRQTPTWVTGQVLGALAKKPLPVAPVRRHTVKVADLRAFVALLRKAFV
jgi:energy-coupling factor transport system substrate-specific component